MKHRELTTCHNEEQLADVTGILQAKGIPFQCEAKVQNLVLGRTSEEQEIAVRVPGEQYEAARAAMEQEYLNSELPPGHFLHDATDQEITELLAEEESWHPFDVAHARRLKNERGIADADIEEQEQEHLEVIRQGRKASTLRLAIGWCSAICGGVIGILMGWSLAYMREKTQEGDYYYFDEPTRNVGTIMFITSIVSFFFSIFLCLR